MKNTHIIAAAVASLALATGVAASATARHEPKLEVDAMTGIPRALLGTAAPQRGLSGGGLPWVIGRAEADLSRSGKLEVSFKDLQFDPTDPAVIAAGTGGTNPVASMKVVVSCLAKDGSVQNVSSPAFPVTTGAGGGDGKIETTVTLPSPCMAPIVFITTTTDRWLAVGSL